MQSLLLIFDFDFKKKGLDFKQYLLERSNLIVEIDPLDAHS
jgi:hypothetical protein